MYKRTVQPHPFLLFISSVIPTAGTLFLTHVPNVSSPNQPHPTSQKHSYTRKIYSFLTTTFDDRSTSQSLQNINRRQNGRRCFLALLLPKYREFANHTTMRYSIEKPQLIKWMEEEKTPMGGQKFEEENLQRLDIKMRLPPTTFPIYRRRFQK